MRCYSSVKQMGIFKVIFLVMDIYGLLQAGVSKNYSAIISDFFPIPIEYEFQYTFHFLLKSKAVN